DCATRSGIAATGRRVACYSLRDRATVLAAAEATSSSDLNSREQHLGRVVLAVGLQVHGLMLEFQQCSLPAGTVLDIEAVSISCVHRRRTLARAVSTPSLTRVTMPLRVVAVPFFGFCKVPARASSCAGLGQRPPARMPRAYGNQSFGIVRTWPTRRLSGSGMSFT